MASCYCFRLLRVHSFFLSRVSRGQAVPSLLDVWRYCVKYKIFESRRWGIVSFCVPRGEDRTSSEKKIGKFMKVCPGEGGK